MHVRKIALAGAFCVLLLAGCSTTVEDKRDALFKKGMSQLDKFRFTDADTTFREVLWTDTTSFLGPIGISLTQERQFLHWDALHFWEKITDRNPNSLEGALGAMRVYRRLGLSEHALRRANLAASLDSTSGDPQVEVARLCLETEQYDAARRTARAAVAVGQPEAVGSMIEARALLLIGNSDSSRTYAERALASPATSSLFYRVAADYFEERRALDSAMFLSAKSLTAGTSGFDEMAEHFFRALRVGYFAEARRLIDSVEAIGGVTPLSTIMDLYYSWATDQDFRGLQVSGVLSQMSLSAISPLMLDALAHDRLSNFTMVDGDLNALQNRLRRGNFEQSFRDFMSYYLALFRTRGHDPVAALGLLRDRYPYRFSDVGHALNELYLVHVTRQPELFTQMLDSLKQFRKTDYRYRTDLADVCGDSAVQEVPRARALYEEALTLHPLYRPAFDGYWKMLNRQRLPEEALSVFEQYPQFAELYPDLAVHNAMFLVRNGKVEAGVEKFLQSFKPVSGDARLTDDMIRWLFRYYRTEEAGRIAEALVGVQGDNVDALAVAAETFNRIGDYERGLELADRALKREPDFSAASAHRAWSLYKLGRNEEAFKLFADVYRVDPESRALLRYYAPALAESGRDKAEAENLARRGVFAGTDILEGWLNLCYVYMLVGRPDLAKGEAIRARNSYLWSPVVHYYVGYAEYLLKQDGARDNLTKAIELGLQGDDLDRANAALEELP